MGLSEKGDCQNYSHVHARHCPDSDCFNYYPEEDVREAVKELKKELSVIKSPEGMIQKLITHKIDEIFGEKLI